MKRLVILLLIASLLAPIAPAADERGIFQASGGSSAHFGFDWHEGCAIEGGAIACGAIASDSDYLAANVEGDKQAYGVEFTISADAEGERSLARIAFTFDHGAVGVGIKGNGRDSYAFADSVQLQLWENSQAGGNWLATLFDVKGGVRTPIATQFNTGIEDGDFHTFRFNVDLDAGKAQVFDGGDVLLAEATLANEHDEFAGQWYVLTSTADGCFGSGAGCPVTTRIGIQGDSTTIYDMDPRAPEIASISATPDPWPASTPLRVSVTATDDWNPGTAIQGELHFEINGAAEQTVSMANTNGVLEGDVPGIAQGSVEYWVTVFDGDSADVFTSDRYEIELDGSPQNKGGGDSKTTPAGGGVGGDAAANQDFLLMAGLAFIAGLGVFILLRRRQARVALWVLILGLVGATLLIMAWQGVFLSPYWLILVPVVVAGYLFLGGRE